MAKKNKPKPVKKPAKKTPVSKPVAKQSSKKKSPVAKKSPKKKQPVKKQAIAPKKTKKTEKKVIKQPVKKKVLKKLTPKSGKSTLKGKKSQKSKKKTALAVKKRKGMSLAEKKKTISKKKIARGSSRFRTIQAILGHYGKEQGIKFGQDFNKMASILYDKTLDQPLKYVEQNIDQLFLRYLKPADVIHEFPDGFPFYEFMEKLAHPIFDGVKIGIDFKDDREVFHIVGFTEEVEAYYRDVIHPYMRINYNESPVAMFEIAETDEKTFVRYNIVAGIDAKTPKEEGEIPVIEKPKEETPPPSKPEKEGQLELEKERNKSLEKQIELEKAKQETEKLQQQTIQLRTAEIKAKMDAIQKLMDMGYNKDEIKDMLK